LSLRFARANVDASNEPIPSPATRPAEVEGRAKIQSVEGIVKPRRGPARLYELGFGPNFSLFGCPSLAAEPRTPGVRRAADHRLALALVGRIT
jgi:hypothetical protein